MTLVVERTFTIFRGCVGVQRPNSEDIGHFASLLHDSLGFRKSNPRFRIQAPGKAWRFVRASSPLECLRQLTARACDLRPREGGYQISRPIKREQRKLEKRVGEFQREPEGLTAAARVLGDSSAVRLGSAQKRVMSAAARAKISRAAKKRWAKVEAGARKAVS